MAALAAARRADVNPMTKLSFSCWGAVAEFERSLILVRQREGWRWPRSAELGERLRSPETGSFDLLA